jgi:hypothetical protein
MPRWLAIDVDLTIGRIVPRFATDELLRFTRFRRWINTSLKRSLGSLIAVLAGWKQIMFWMTTLFAAAVGCDRSRATRYATPGSAAVI